LDTPGGSRLWGFSKALGLRLGKAERDGPGLLWENARGSTLPLGAGESQGGHFNHRVAHHRMGWHWPVAGSWSLASPAGRLEGTFHLSDRKCIDDRESGNAGGRKTGGR